MQKIQTPFSKFEWMIAMRYLQAARKESGVSLMTWISLIGITLAVFALVATLSVRSGFRAEFVSSIFSTDGHLNLISARAENPNLIPDYELLQARLMKVEGVSRATPLVRGQVMINTRDTNLGVEVYGIGSADLRTLPFMSEDKVEPKVRAQFSNGIALGSGVARRLGVGPGDQIKLVSPSGVKTAFGTSPRISAYEVIFVFDAGRYDVDMTRVYLPLGAAQTFFNKDGGVDEFEISVIDAENPEKYTDALLQAAGEHVAIFTWKDASGGFLRALEMEDNVMFIMLSILILIATLNIISGLIMLVKSKNRDIGILRTIGLSQGSILRVFFICGASTGVVGTILGVALGCLFAIYIDPIFAFVDGLAGGGAWDPAIRGIYALPAQLRVSDVLSAAGMSLGLSFLITLVPSRRAARLNPVEALRYE